MSKPTDEPGGDAVRLVFTYEQGTVRLVGQHRVDIAVTGFDAASHRRSGDFVEVRDAAGTGLSQVPIHSGLDTSIEVFPDKPGDPIIRVEAAQDTGFPWADWFNISGGNAAPGSQIAAIARFPQRLDIFAVGGDSSVYTAGWDGANGWSNWFAVGVT